MVDQNSNRGSSTNLGADSIEDDPLRELAELLGGAGQDKPSRESQTPPDQAVPQGEHQSSDGHHDNTIGGEFSNLANELAAQLDESSGIEAELMQSLGAVEEPQAPVDRTVSNQEPHNGMPDPHSVAAEPEDDFESSLEAELFAMNAPDLGLPDVEARQAADANAEAHADEANAAAAEMLKQADVATQEAEIASGHNEADREINLEAELEQALGLEKDFVDIEPVEDDAIFAAEVEANLEAELVHETGSQDEMEFLGVEATLPPETADSPNMDAADSVASAFAALEETQISDIANDGNGPAEQVVVDPSTLSEAVVDDGSSMVSVEEDELFSVLDETGLSPDRGANSEEDFDLDMGAEFEAELKAGPENSQDIASEPEPILETVPQPGEESLSQFETDLDDEFNSLELDFTDDSTDVETAETAPATVENTTDEPDWAVETSLEQPLSGRVIDEIRQTFEGPQAEAEATATVEQPVENGQEISAAPEPAEEVVLNDLENLEIGEDEFLMAIDDELAIEDEQGVEGVAEEVPGEVTGIAAQNVEDASAFEVPEVASSEMEAPEIATSEIEPVTQEEAEPSLEDLLSQDWYGLDDQADNQQSEPVSVEDMPQDNSDDLTAQQEAWEVSEYSFDEPEQSEAPQHPEQIDDLDAVLQGELEVAASEGEPHEAVTSFTESVEPEPEVAQPASPSEPVSYDFGAAFEDALVQSEGAEIDSDELLEGMEPDFKGLVAENDDSISQAADELADILADETEEIAAEAPIVEETQEDGITDLEDEFAAAFSSEIAFDAFDEQVAQTQEELLADEIPQEDFDLSLDDFEDFSAEPQGTDAAKPVYEESGFEFSEDDALPNVISEAAARAASGAESGTASLAATGAAAATAAGAVASSQKSGNKGGFKVAGIALAVALFMGIGFVAYGIMNRVDNSAPPLIKADTGPVKMKPKDPGGKVIANTDKAAYEGVDGTGLKAGQDKLKTDTEKPVDIATNEKTDARLQPGAKDDEKSAGLTLAPRKVKTLTVKPDGTIVAEPAPAPIKDQAAEQMANLRGTAGSIDGAKTTNVIGVPEPNPNAEKDAQQKDVNFAPPTVKPAARPKVTNSVPAKKVKSQTITLNSEKPEAPKQQAKKEAPKPVQQATGNYPWAVQVSSQRSEAEAKAAYAKMRSRFASVLGNQQVQILRADVGGQGIYYRVRIPATSKQSASNLCNRLKSAGGDCFITR